MKAKPTDLDRQAAGLFTAAPGMRAWSEFCCGRVQHAAPDSSGTVYATLAGEGAYEGLALVVAFDADDPPTQGAMLAQVEEAARPRLDAEPLLKDLHLILVSRWKDYRRIGWRVIDDAGVGAFVGPLAETRGAALVAAMTALKKAPAAPA